jgi:decaprenylphospho-beta-D-erythro-pentofuranosid-2-ulose 2-reductase
MAEKIFILGATSVLAHETAKLFAREGAAFALAGRDRRKLKTVTDDLRQQGASRVVPIALDVKDRRRYAAVLRQAVRALGGLDMALLAHGTACQVGECEKNQERLAQEIHTNFTATASWLMLLADFFEKQRRGTIAVISSVAGDRGRREQYIYAACKAGLNVFLQGLRQRLHPARVAVVTLKPGLTDTPLMAHLKKGALFSRPEKVARGMARAIRAKKAEVYLPWYWKHIMCLIRLIPESLFKRLRTLVNDKD